MGVSAATPRAATAAPPFQRQRKAVSGREPPAAPAWYVMSMRSTWFVVAWVLGVALVGAGLAVGCGGSSGGAQGHADAGDATSELAFAPDVVVDAGPDINQDPDVYPAQHHPIPQLDFNGGPILEHPRIVTVTFTGNPHRAAIRDFDHFIVTTPWWKQTAEGFCVDAGPSAGGCVGDGTAKAPEGGAWRPDGSTDDAGDGFLDVELAYDFASDQILDSDIQTWLAGHLKAGDFPASDDQTIYALFFPQTTSITVQNPTGTSCQQFGGYHDNMPAPVGKGRVYYAVLPYCDYGQGENVNYQQLTFATSHELTEAVTDPDVNDLTAFYLFTNDAWLGSTGGLGGECGDLCFYVSAYSPYDESGYTVTRVWSNQAAAQSMQPCQPWTKTYYAAALRTAPQKIPPDNHVSDGYVFVKRGKSVDVVADVFAQAPLPHDVLLYAGVPKQGATDPTALDPPEDLVTVTISQQQVNNGDGVVVTFSAPSNATTGDQPMVIRAVLENDDYNDWPVIVHVQ